MWQTWPLQLTKVVYAVNLNSIRKNGKIVNSVRQAAQVCLHGNAGKIGRIVGEELESVLNKRNASEAAGSFADLSLSKVMMESLAKAGYEVPSPIQAGLIPHALKGIDVLGQAQTGTGKTAAFAIPILEGLKPRKEVHAPQALVLVPTRELAVQVREEFAKLAAGQRVSCVAIYGGKPFRSQLEKLQRGVEVVVGTPGRILDHIGRGTLDLSKLSCVVLDEADRMLDIGFRPDIEKILRRCPKDRHTMLLSATVPPPIQRLAQRYMNDPVMVDFSERQVAVETIEQFYFTVDQDRKFGLLGRLIEREEPKQAIIFCRTRRGTEKLNQRLSKRYPKLKISCIHGDLQQRVRDRVMADFRQGKVRVLVATDVVGRGIDVTGVSHIINHDIPEFCDDYVHRVGRTGRMGAEGIAFSFVTPEEGHKLTSIEERINKLLIRDEIGNYEAVAQRRSQVAVDPEEEPEPETPKRPVPGGRQRRHRRGL